MQTIEKRYSVVKLRSGRFRGGVLRNLSLMTIIVMKVVVIELHKNKVKNIL